MIKIYIFISILLTGHLCISQTHKATGKKIGTTPVKIIFDTDMGPDYDDIGAIAVLHALADRGECEILATVSCDGHPSIAPTIEIYNRYFNRAHIPVGRASTTAPDFTAPNNWNDTIVNRYGLDLKGKSYPRAVEIYRKVLASQPDHSVVVVSVGFLSNLADLLNSGEMSILH